MDHDGWSAPLSHGLVAPQLLGGIPREVFVLLFVGTMLGLLWYWPLTLVTLGLYGLSWLGTQYDAHWFGIVREHCMLSRHYEA